MEEIEEVEYLIPAITPTPANYETFKTPFGQAIINSTHAN